MGLCTLFRTGTYVWSIFHSFPSKELVSINRTVSKGWLYSIRYMYNYESHTRYSTVSNPLWPNLLTPFKIQDFHRLCCKKWSTRESVTLEHDEVVLHLGWREGELRSDRLISKHWLCYFIFTRCTKEVGTVFFRTSMTDQEYSTNRTPFDLRSILQVDGTQSIYPFRCTLKGSTVELVGGSGRLVHLLCTTCRSGQLRSLLKSRSIVDWHWCSLYGSLFRIRVGKVLKTGCFSTHFIIPSKPFHIIEYGH